MKKIFSLAVFFFFGTLFANANSKNKNGIKESLYYLRDSNNVSITITNESKNSESIEILKTKCFEDVMAIQCTVYSEFSIDDGSGWTIQYLAVKTANTCEEAGRQMDLWVSMMTDFGFELVER